MDAYSDRMKGRIGYSSVILTFGGIFAGLLGLSELLFAQVYPLLSLVLTGLAVAATCGLFSHSEESASSSR